MGRSVGLAALLLAAGAARAQDAPVLVLKDHTFQPSSLTVPAGKPLKLRIENHDATPEEFESHAMRAEKVVVPNGAITVAVGALKPGTYEFWGEYHRDTARGTLVVVPETN